MYYYVTNLSKALVRFGGTDNARVLNSEPTILSMS